MSDMVSARKTDVYVGINGVNVWGDIKKYVKSVTFSESASGESDSLEIEMHDIDNHWIDDWLIDKGTLLDAKIKVMHSGADEKWIDCGEFICDSLHFGGFPVTVTVGALSMPNNREKHEQAWENITLTAIANEIAWRSGCELFYDAGDVKIESVSQNSQNDIEFLYKLCRDYGLGMKVFRRKVVIFDRIETDAREAVGTINIADIAESFNLDDNQEGTYTGARMNYEIAGNDTNGTYTGSLIDYKPKNIAANAESAAKLIEGVTKKGGAKGLYAADNSGAYSYGGGERILMIDETAKSAAEAELKCRGKLYETNAAAVKLSFECMGGYEIYPGVNYYIKGLGGYSGKYAVDKVTHTVSEGSYMLSIETHAVGLEKDKQNGINAANTNENAGNSKERRKLSGSGKKVFLSPV